MRQVSIALCAFALVVQAGCSPHKVTKNPEAPIELPEAFTHLQENAANLPEKWWMDFHDPALNALVDEALSQNLQVKAAWERVRQARFIAKQASSGKYPQLNATASLTHSEPENPFFPASPVSLDASYEVDVFRRIGNTADAAVLDTLSARDQVESLAMTLVAQIADTWFALQSQRAQLILLEDQVSVSKNFLELAEMRLQQGLGSALDVLQQRQQLASVQAQAPVLESSIAVLENQLQVLTGKAPQAGQIAESTLPDLPPMPGSGVPADLLLRRPDVRAAQRQVVSADYRVAAAVAARLPRLQLTARYGPFVRFGNGAFQEQSAWNLVANLFGPIFQGGQLKAEVKRNESVVHERSYNYGQTLLQAILEVENSLVQEAKQIEYLQALEAQLVIAQQTLEEARQRYSAGIGDQSFLAILSALSTQQQVEQNILRAKQRSLSIRVQLCRALGGSWTRSWDPSKKASDNKTAVNEGSKNE